MAAWPDRVADGRDPADPPRRRAARRRPERASAPRNRAKCVSDQPADCLRRRLDLESITDMVKRGGAVVVEARQLHGILVSRSRIGQILTRLTGNDAHRAVTLQRDPNEQSHTGNNSTLTRYLCTDMHLWFGAALLP
jgi:hypothetical protein